MEEDIPHNLIIEYFQPGNPVRNFLDVHGRIRKRMLEVRKTMPDGRVPFDRPVM
jgi:hypothetical protein